MSSTKWLWGDIPPYPPTLNPRDDLFRRFKDHTSPVVYVGQTLRVTFLGVPATVVVTAVRVAKSYKYSSYAARPDSTYEIRCVELAEDDSGVKYLYPPHVAWKSFSPRFRDELCEHKSP